MEQKYVSDEITQAAARNAGLCLCTAEDRAYFADGGETLKGMDDVYHLSARDVKDCIRRITEHYEVKTEKIDGKLNLTKEISTRDGMAESFSALYDCIVILKNMFLFFDEPVDENEDAEHESIYERIGAYTAASALFDNSGGEADEMKTDGKLLVQLGNIKLNLIKSQLKLCGSLKTTEAIIDEEMRLLQERLCETTERAEKLRAANRGRLSEAVSNEHTAEIFDIMADKFIGEESDKILGISKSSLLSDLETAKAIAAGAKYDFKKCVSKLSKLTDKSEEYVMSNYFSINSSEDIEE